MIEPGTICYNEHVGICTVTGHDHDDRAIVEYVGARRGRVIAHIPDHRLRIVGEKP